MMIASILLWSNLFSNLVAGLWKFPGKSHIMHVKHVKNQQKKNKWDCFNVQTVKRWLKLYLPLPYL